MCLGTGTNAQIAAPNGMAYQNNYLYVFESTGGRVRKIDLSTSIVSSIVSTFTYTAMKGGGLDSSGNIFVLDAHRITKITSQTSAAVFAGSTSSALTDGTGTNAAFNTPWCVYVIFHIYIYI